MSNAFRTRLLALALLGAVVLVVAASSLAIPVSGGLGQATAANAEPPTSAPTPYADRRATKPSRPKPTLGERAAAFALEAVGVPYRWGGESPASGFDCSGLVRWSYLRLGIGLPHSSYALYSSGRRVRRAHMKPGDVLVFSGLGHVGLYLGRGRMVHAPQSGRHVEVVRLDATSYGSRLVAARRVTAA